MTEKEIYRKVQLLKAGVTVEINGDTFYAERIDSLLADYPCSYCNLDSICQGDVNTICAALENYGKARWLLHLAHP